MRLTTWNVLHRVHAEKWSEPLAGAYRDERVRVEAITRRVLAALGESDVVCLQEVSGDQLASLRAEMQVLDLALPRIPRGSPKMDDPSEHLAIAFAKRARVAEAAVFDNDPGKGWLAIEVEGWIVVSAHITYRRPGDAQLEVLADFARAADRPIALAGDFNRERVDLALALEGFAISSAPAGSLSTRASKGVSQNIDHIAVLRGEAIDVVVESSEGLSDHNLVSCRLTEAR